MFRRRNPSFPSAFRIVLCAASFAMPSALWAMPNIADQVVSYHPGDDSSAGYRDPGAALGMLKPVADPIFGNSILSPFNPPYLPDDLVIVGAGGELTLKLARPVAAQAGPEIGVFCNNGLIDISYPTGQNQVPAGFFSEAPRAIVSVSRDGTNFVPLFSGNPFTFDGVSNYYADLGPNPSSTTTPGDVLAAMDKPFLAPLSAFDGLDWIATRTLLDGSAGGRWLDISSTGLATAQYVRFEVPAGADYRMVLDAVSGAKLLSRPPIPPNGDDRAGGGDRSSIPEPTSLVASLGILAGGARRPQNRRRAAS
jgi:hypothetical protein